VLQQRLVQLRSGLVSAVQNGHTNAHGAFATGAVDVQINEIGARPIDPNVEMLPNQKLHQIIFVQAAVLGLHRLGIAQACFEPNLRELATSSAAIAVLYISPEVRAIRHAQAGVATAPKQQKRTETEEERQVPHVKSNP
jgi:hypothetical protein